MCELTLTASVAGQGEPFPDFMTSARREPMVSVVFFVLRGGIVDVVYDLVDLLCGVENGGWWSILQQESRSGKLFLRAL
jgi:hypothetical protein